MSTISELGAFLARETAAGAAAAAQPTAIGSITSRQSPRAPAKTKPDNDGKQS
jgi:hypothetical protein